MPVLMHLISVGSALYYARAVDPTLLPALDDIANSQAKPTQDTLHKSNQLLDSLSTYPNAIIRYHASDVILAPLSPFAKIVDVENVGFLGDVR